MSPVYIIMAAIICTIGWEYLKIKDIDKKSTDNHEEDEADDDDDEKNVEFISSKKEND
jgi:hypothetical protein